MKIDDLNIAIIKHLIDGRKAYKLIANDLNVSENTIRARVNKMREAGILEIAGLVDTSAIPGHSTVIIGSGQNVHGIPSGDSGAGFVLALEPGIATWQNRAGDHVDHSLDLSKPENPPQIIAHRVTFKRLA